MLVVLGGRGGLDHLDNEGPYTPSTPHIGGIGQQSFQSRTSPPRGPYAIEPHRPRPVWLALYRDFRLRRQPWLNIAARSVALCARNEPSRRQQSSQEPGQMPGVNQAPSSRPLDPLTRTWARSPAAASAPPRPASAPRPAQLGRLEPLLHPRQVGRHAPGDLTRVPWPDAAPRQTVTGKGDELGVGPAGIEPRKASVESPCAAMSRISSRVDPQTAAYR